MCIYSLRVAAWYVCIYVYSMSSYTILMDMHTLRACAERRERGREGIDNIYKNKHTTTTTTTTNNNNNNDNDYNNNSNDNTNNMYIYIYTHTLT